MNEETYRQTLQHDCSESDVPPMESGLQVYFGSLHDVLAYPCEVRHDFVQLTLDEHEVGGET